MIILALRFRVQGWLNLHW